MKNRLRWKKLKLALINKRSQLGESQTLQQFSRDADEIENWITEKLQIACEESYRDPTNIQVDSFGLDFSLRFDLLDFFFFLEQTSETTSFQG